MKTKPHTQPSPWLCFRIGRTYRGIFFSEISRKYTKRRIKKGICQIGYTTASSEIYVGNLTSTLLIIISNLSQFFERDAMPWATLAEGPSTDPSLGLTLGTGLPAFWAGPGHHTSNAQKGCTKYVSMRMHKDMMYLHTTFIYMLSFQMQLTHCFVLSWSSKAHPASYPSHLHVLLSCCSLQSVCRECEPKQCKQDQTGVFSNTHKHTLLACTSHELQIMGYGCWWPWSLQPPQVSANMYVLRKTKRSRFHESLFPCLDYLS